MHEYFMSDDKQTSSLDPIWLTEKAVQALRAGQLEEAAGVSRAGFQHRRSRPRLRVPKPRQRVP